MCHTVFPYMSHIKYFYKVNVTYNQSFLYNMYSIDLNVHACVCIFPDKQP